MTRIIRAVFDEQGYPDGFYPSDLWPTGYPENAIEISEAQWQEFLNNQNARRWSDGEVVEAAPRPSLPLTSEQEEEIEEIARQHLEMQSLIAQTVLSWSAIESGLAWLLSSITGAQDGADQQVAFAILFSSPGLEAKISMVKDAFAALTSRAVDVNTQNAALAQWSNLEKILKSSKRTRNTVAHGSIATVAVPSGNKGAIKNYVRLTPNIFDAKRTDWSATKGGAPVGLSVSDLKHSLERLIPTNDLIASLRKTAEELRLGTFRAPTE